MTTLIETVVAAVAEKITPHGPMDPALDIVPDPAIDVTEPASKAMALEEELFAHTAAALVSSTFDLCHPEEPAEGVAIREEVVVISAEDATDPAALEQALADALPLLEIDGPVMEPEPA